MVTIHRSSILRGEPDERESELAAFVADLRLAAPATSTGWSG